MSKLNPKNIGKNLSAILEELDIYQAEFAERAGISVTAVSQLISGRGLPSLETVCKILSVIPCSFERLLK